MKRSIEYIFLFFFAGSITGWFWEALVFWWNHSEYSVISILLDYRGVLHGLWVPIYGFGCVLLLMLGTRLKSHPIWLLISSITACGVMEYVTSYILEKQFHARWWDYSNAFLNLNGRICASSLLFFGLAGLAVIYLAEPKFYAVVKKFSAQAQKTAAVILLVLFALDTAVALISPNMGIGVTEKVI